ncbi:MAG: hypothetical protein ALECFALPRED_007808 [Alectoria fallacina]|uniref:Uncharacterized protein n=1 Tax=Alectoria fallacina TaxID=1903189 RepID=A0A8H3J0W5_9LECA|nr:MAG: hypothetical protein ALECFALPRED_007808 [Alectoria fallacina]
MAPTPGGLLFKLPRPVRDKIYRALVKGPNRLVGPSYWTSREVTEDELESKGDDIDLTILQMSSAIHRGAMAVLYSESTFNIHIDFEGDQIWETAIGKFAGTDRVRDSMHVIVDVRTPDMEDAELRPMYRGL